MEFYEFLGKVIFVIFMFFDFLMGEFDSFCLCFDDIV